MQGLSEHPVHEHTQEDFYLHALLLLFFASQNRPMVATRYAVGADFCIQLYHHFTSSPITRRTQSCM